MTTTVNKNIPSVGTKRELARKRSDLAQQNVKGPINNLDRGIGKLSGPSQWILIGMYSLCCFLMGIVLKPYLYPPEYKADTGVSDSVQFLAKRNQEGFKRSIASLSEIESLLLKLESQMDKQGMKARNIESSIVDLRKLQKAFLFEGPENVRGKETISRKKNQFTTNSRGKKIGDDLAVKHSQLLADLRKDHQDRRKQFLAQNEISSAEGLKAWEDFSRGLLREKQRLNRIIWNEKKTFRTR